MQNELILLDKEEFVLIKKMQEMITKKVHQFREYILNYRIDLQNKIKMMKVVKVESIQLKRKIQSLDNMEIQRLYDKVQIVPKLIENCRSFRLIPFDCKIIFLEKSKSKSIIDKYKQISENIEKKIIQCSTFCKYIRNQASSIDKKIQGDEQELCEYLKTNLSIKIATNKNSSKFIQMKQGISCLTKLILLNILHIQKFNSNVIYSFKNKEYLYRILQESLLKFTNRNRNISYVDEIIIKKKIRKQNKLFTNQLQHISISIQDKKKKLVPEKVFLPLLSKDKALAFERKRVNSPYLFYSTLATPIVLHIYNLISKQPKTFNLYNSNQDYCDVEQHESKIFICGGYYNGEIKTSWMIELSNLNFAQGHPTKDLLDTRREHTLVSTPFELYALGGYVHPNYTKTCEKFTKSGVWEKSEDLNQASYYVTASYVYPHYLYKFGAASSSSIERLYLKSASKWKDLQVQNSTQRHYGCPLQLNENEVLLINGGSAPNEFQKFNLQNKTLSNTGRPLTSYYYFHSKIRLLAGKIHIISIKHNKRVLIDLKELSFSEGGIDF